MSIDYYFAGGINKPVNDYLIQNNCNRLLSQLIDRPNIKDYFTFQVENEPRTLFIDSGAYTAWSKGKTIDVDEYINFINDNIDYITLFASVDNIPGELHRPPTHKELQESPILSWNNYLYMRERVKDKDKLIPVFHIGEDFKHLQNMLNTKLDGKYIPYIGLGGTVGLNCNTKSNWYNTVFRVIRESENPNVKTHAFGLSNFKILEVYPFTSCDSTSWIRIAATGKMVTKYGTISMERNKASSMHITNLSKEILKEIESELHQYNLDLQQCIDDSKCRMIANFHYLQNRIKEYEYKGNNTYTKRLF